MRFSEAEERYRELEAQLVRGELKEDEFLTQVSQLRVLDQDGRRWMLSSRTGRWLVHDGQQWVFAEPPPEGAEPEPPATAQPAPAEKAPLAVATPPSAAPAPTSFAPPAIVAGITALLLVGCLIGGGVAAWVFLLRDWNEASPAAPPSTSVGFVQTYTPRPATPTYTPTLTPTPSRTPTATNTPIVTNTPRATNTPPPSATPSATSTAQPAATATPTWTPLALATKAPTVVSAVSATPSATPSPTVTATPAPASGQTYTVKKGDTLFGIAIRFGISVDALAKANGISNTKLIRPGQVLVIPVPGTTPATPTRTGTPTRTPKATATPASTRATATPTSTRATATATATRSGATATAKPTTKPTAKPTATPKPVALTGKIAFTVWNPYHSKYELYVSRIDGSGRNMLGEGFRQPQFRQDGNLLAANGDGAPNLEHLVTMDASGGNKAEVSTNSEDSFPTWSKDGAIVAFSSSSWGDGLTRLGIVHDMFGKQQEWIRIGTTEIQGNYPFWMADGRIVYHGCDFLQGGGACGLYWVGAGGGNYHRLTNHESDTAPAGSQGRVTFMSSRDGNWEIYVVNMDSGSLKRLTNNGAQDGLPTWSPDGKSIAFVSNRGGTWAIWVMDASGGNQRKLFDLGGGYGTGEFAWTNERISWAP